MSGPSWAYCTTNLTGTPSLTPGTSVTNGISNADGTAVAALTNLTHDVEYLVISINGFSVSGSSVGVLMDVILDPSGGTTFTATPIIPALICGQTAGGTSTIGQQICYHFPIWIKAGSSIGFRCRSNHTAGIAGRVVVMAYGGNQCPASWWCGQYVTNYGITAASSTGTSHTPGSTGAYSTWTNLGSTSPAPAGAIQYGVQNTQATSLQAVEHIEFGVGSQRIGPPLWHSVSTAEQGYTHHTGPIFVSLPASTQLMVRATGDATAQAVWVGAYLVH